MRDQTVSAPARGVTVLSGTKGFDRVRARQFREGLTVWQAIDGHVPADLHRSLEVSIQSLGPDGTSLCRPVPPAMWMTTRLKAGEQLVVGLVPQGENNKVLRSVLMLVVIVASYYLGPEVAEGLGYGTTATGAQSLAGVTLTSTGLTVANVASGLIAGLGALAVNALVPISLPKPDSEQATSYLNQVSNIFGADKKVPVPMGDVTFYPPQAAWPIVRSNGKRRVQTALFCLGYGPLKVHEDSILIGNTPLSQFSGVRFGYTEGWPDDAPLALYPDDVYPDHSYQPTLAADQAFIVTTQAATDRAELELLFPTGLVYFNDLGERVRRTVSFYVRYRVHGTGTWSAPEARDVLQDNEEVMRVAGDSASSNLYANRLNTGVYSVTDRTASPRSFQIELDFPSRGTYDIEITRTSPEPAEADKDHVRDAVGIYELRSISDNPPVSMTGVALLALELPLNDQKPGGATDLSVRVERYMPIYENGAWVYPHDTRAGGGDLSKHLTSNPAYAFVYAAHGYGLENGIKRPGTPSKRPVPVNALDTATILAWRDVCDAPDIRTGQARFRYDDVVASGLPLRKILSDIAQAGRARIAGPSGRLGVAIDRMQSAPLGIFTPRNTRSLSGTLKLTPQPHGVSVTIRDRDNGFAKSNIIAYRETYDASNATDIVKIEAPGVTERWRAWDQAEYYRRMAIARAETIVFTASVDALHNNVGDYVLLKHDVPQLSTDRAADDFPGARVRAVLTDASGNATGLRLDEPVTMAAGQNYAVAVRRADSAAMVLKASVVTETGESAILTFVDPVPAPHGLANGDLAVFGVANQEAREVIITNIQPSGELAAQITVVDLANSDLYDIDTIAIDGFDPYVNLVSEVRTAAPDVVRDLEAQENIITETGVERLRISLSWRPGLTGQPADHFDIYQQTTEDHGGITESQYRFFGTTIDQNFVLPHDFLTGEAVTFAVVAVSAAGTRRPAKDSTHVSITPTLAGDDSLIRNDAAGSGNRLWMFTDTKAGIEVTPTLSTNTSVTAIGSDIQDVAIQMVAGDPITFSAALRTDTAALFQARFSMLFLDAGGASVGTAEGLWVYPTGARVGVTGAWPVGATQVRLQLEVRNPSGVSATDTVRATGLSLTEGITLVPWTVPTTRNVFRGVYDVVTTYGQGDIVTFQGSSYVYVNDVAMAGAGIGDTAYWQLFAAAGTDAALLSLQPTAQTFTYNGGGAATPATQQISFGAVHPNLAGTPVFTATAYDAAGTSLGALTMGGAGNTRTLDVATFGAAAYAVVTAAIGTYSDTVTVVRLTDGTDALTAFLTNEAHTVSADAAGVVASFANAGGTFKVYLGTTDITTSHGVSYTVTGQSGVVGAINATTGVYSVSAMSADTGTLSLSATYGSSTIDKTFTLSKARAGIDGSSGYNIARLMLFRRAATSPALPSATAAYVFSTDSLSGINNSWQRTVPVGTDPLYVTVASAVSSGTSDTIASTDWSSPVILAQDGANGADGAAGVAGANGLNSATVFLYKRATSTPALPSVSTTYTFSTRVLSGANNGWTQTIPTGTNPIYVTTATAVNTGSSDSIASSEWAAASVLAQNGANGSNGADGANGLTISVTPQAFTVACASDGTPKAGEFNKTAQIALFSGTTNVTTSASYVLTTSNCTASVSTGGLVTISAIGADAAYVEVTASYSGIALVQRITLAKAKDGSSSISAVSDAYPPGSTSYVTVNTTAVSLALPGSGNAVSLYGHINFIGNSDVDLKAQYSTNGGSTWSDAGTAVTASSTSTEPSFLTLNQSVTGPSSPAVWQFRLVGRYAGSAPSAYGAQVGKFSAGSS